MSLGLDPATLGSLQGTLSGPMGLLWKAEQDRLAEEAALAEKTRQTSAAAASAASQYQSAAAAPTPQLDPLSALITTLAGNVGSVVANDRSFADRAHEDLKNQRAELMLARTQNLNALKSAYDQKAALAEKAGDLETTLTSRGKSEQLAKALQVMLQNQTQDFQRERDAAHQAGAMDLERLKQQGDERTAKAKAAADSAGYFDTLVTTTRAGNKFLDLTNVPTPKQKAQAMQYAKETGVTALNKNDVAQLRTADEVNAGLDQVESMLGSVLPHQSGNSVRDFLTRQARGAANAGQAIAQSNSIPAAFGSTMPLAIRSLQAVAAGPGSGFRLNQAEINMINRRWPRLNDNIETAKAKLLWERWFLRNKENSYFSRDWGVEPEPDVPGQAKTGLIGGGAARDTSGNDPLGIR